MTYSYFSLLFLCIISIIILFYSEKSNLDFIYNHNDLLPQSVGVSLFNLTRSCSDENLMCDDLIEKVFQRTEKDHVYLGCAVLTTKRAVKIFVYEKNTHVANPHLENWISIQTKFLNDVVNHSDFTCKEQPVLFLLGDSLGLSSENEEWLQSVCVPLLVHANYISHNTSNFIFQPDYHFIAYEGFKSMINDFSKVNISSQAKHPKIFWRGSSTGTAQSCENLPRIQFAKLTRDIPWIDFKISALVQACAGNNLSSEITSAKTREVDWLESRGIIDIDGNINAFGLFWRLLSGSVVFRVENSRGIVNSYSQFLRPYVHYIPIYPPFTKESIQNSTKIILSTNSKDIILLESIAIRSRELALRFSYRSEVARVAQELSGKYFLKCTPSYNDR